VPVNWQSQRRNENDGAHVRLRSFRDLRRRLLLRRYWRASGHLACRRDWPDVTRTREMLVLAEEFVP
jgi:hypothetical protein